MDLVFENVGCVVVVVVVVVVSVGVGGKEIFVEGKVSGESGLVKGSEEVKGCFCVNFVDLVVFLLVDESLLDVVGVGGDGFNVSF